MQKCKIHVFIYAYIYYGMCKRMPRKFIPIEMYTFEGIKHQTNQRVSEYEPTLLFAHTMCKWLSVCVCVCAHLVGGGGRNTHTLSHTSHILIKCFIEHITENAKKPKRMEEKLFAHKLHKILCTHTSIHIYSRSTQANHRGIHFNTHTLRPNTR